MQFEMPPAPAERDPFAGWARRETSMLETAARLGRNPERGGALSQACTAMTDRLLEGQEH